MKKTPWRRFIGCGLFFVTLCVGTWASSAPLVDYKGQPIEIDAIAMTQAKEWFQEALKTPKIPFSYIEQGCEAKAHFFALFFDKRGVKTAKTFVEGNLFWTDKIFWTFHVASVVKIIGENGETSPYVLDPLVVDEPVPYDRWFEKISHHRFTKIKEKYFTNQYVYSSTEKNSSIDYFDQYFVDDMWTVFKVINRRIEWEIGRR